MSTIEKALERLRTAKSVPRATKRVLDLPVNDAREGSSERRGQAVDLQLSALRKEGFLTPDQADSPLAEEYRLLKRPILMNAFGKGAGDVELGNLVMITSAVPGEGKTFTALNLAISMSLEKDTTVLLVDSDVIKRSLSIHMGLGEAPGLIDVLVDPGMGLQRVISRTNVEKLTMIPAGRQDSRATELLASMQMKSLAVELAHRYSDRIVILDAPPLLATSHAPVLSELAGQIVVVVEASRTLQHSVAEALALIGPEKVAGVVLNKSRHRFSRNYYGSYYRKRA
jgi:receptor protein-tyrosine kinase